MNEFINTIDILGDEAVQDMLIEDTLTELNENRLTGLREAAFRGSSIANVRLPCANGLHAYAMYDCDNLIRFCMNIESTNAYMFQKCDGLKIAHFTMPIFLYVGLLGDCPSLDTVIFSNKHVIAPTAGLSWCGNTPIANGTGYVYVRKRLIGQYRNETNWSAIASQIRAIEDYPEIKAIVDADIAEMRGETV